MSKDLVADMFNDDSTIPESNWFKFEKVGDAIGGVLQEIPTERDGNFGTQTIYVIEKPDGEIWNVALKNSSQAGAIAMLRRANVGDAVAFRLKELKDTGKGNPAKIIEVRHRPKE